MDPAVTLDSYDDLLAAWKANLDRNIALNKAPYGIYLHYFWFYNSSSLLDTLKM
jgi:hypothetical protein